MAVVGTPIPKIKDVIIVQKRRRIICPPDNPTKKEANFNPTPVLVTTPIIMPAAAQAISTPKAPLAPFINPLTISLNVIRVVSRSMAVKIEITIPANAAFIGVYPEARSPIIDIRGIAK